MNISDHSFSIYTLSLFGENFVPFLTAQQKRILILSSIAFGFLAACFVANHCSFRFKRMNGQVKQTYSNEESLTINKFKKQETATSKTLSETNSILLENALEYLPQEILLHILTFLDRKGWSAISLTNKFMRHLSQDPTAIASLLKILENNHFLLPLDKKLKLAKQAGPFLTQLNLEKSIVTDQELEELFIKCPKIQSLNLSRCENLTHAVINKMPQGLLSLDLSYCLGMDVAIDKLPEGLLSLNLAYSLDITGAVIDKLPKSLLRLNLANWWYLTDDGIEKLPQGLLSLDLSGCVELKNLAPISKLQGLLSLNLSGCVRLTNSAIKKLPRSLLSLNLENCCRLTDAAISYLPEGLHSINLHKCSNLTKAGIYKLPKSLKSVNLNGSFELKHDAIDHWKNGGSSLVNVDNKARKVN